MVEPYPHWRRMQEEDFEDFNNWLTDEFEKAWEKGDEKYNSYEDGFQGDPFQHLKEELLGALVYWYYEDRRRNNPEGV